jgi:hypothetical protein
VYKIVFFFVFVLVSGITLYINGNELEQQNKISLYDTMYDGKIPVISISTISLSFGDVVVSEKSVPQTIIISNVGKAPLQISSIKVPTEFLISGTNPPISIFTNQSIHYQVTFAPIKLGEKSGKIIISSNDLTYPTIAIDVSGNSVEKTVLGIPSTTIPTPTQSTESTPSGGCLIATATFGSELAPQVQQLRELRDNTLLKTSSGSAFMTGFNTFYYSFSPAVADLEKQNPAFREIVKVTITPLISTLSILNYVDINSETEMLGYGIGIILLNIGMYFVAPVIVIIRLKSMKSGDFKCQW